eukprot:COSAG06_NODE_14771_length_1127_cov_1.525292_2_plen_37_part_01
MLYLGLQYKVFLGLTRPPQNARFQPCTSGFSDRKIDY